MWWILAFVGLVAFLVLLAAAAWFLFRPRPKRPVDDYDPDFAPRDPEPSPEPTLAEPGPAAPTWSPDAFQPVELPTPPRLERPQPAEAAPAAEPAVEENAPAEAEPPDAEPPIAGAVDAEPPVDADPPVDTQTPEDAQPPVAPPAEPADIPAPRFTSSPTVIPDEAWESPPPEAPAAPPVEAPEPVEPAAESQVEAAAVEPAVAASAEPAVAEPAAEPGAGDAAPEEPPVFDMIQKARIAGVDLVLRAHAVRFGAEELLGFVTEGFAAQGKADLALYMAMPEGDPIEEIKAGLKFFSFVALKLQERSGPVHADDVLLFPGHIGALNFGGFLAIAPNEPVAVPMDAHVVLLAVPKSRMSTDPAVLRGMLAVGGVLPYRSEPGA